MENNTLAFETLKELKNSHRRIFIIAIIECIIIIGMFVGVLIYESQFEYVSAVSQTQEVNDSQEIVQTIKGE